MKYQLIFKEYISYSQDVNKDKSKEIIQNTGTPPLFDFTIFPHRLPLVCNAKRKITKTIKSELWNCWTYGGLLYIF